LNAILEYAGIPKTRGPDVLRIVDKLDKLGTETVTAELKNLNMNSASMDAFLPFLNIKGNRRRCCASCGGPSKTHPPAPKACWRWRSFSDTSRISPYPETDIAGM
jgi:histidyl-tRNA synthetase